MENLNILPTDTTPAIDFDYEAQELKITGESYPENARRFFDPAIDWIEKFLSAGNDRSIVVEIKLIMFNSSTAKILLEILDILDDGCASEKSITVNWRYHKDNDQVEEFGHDLQDDYPAIVVNMMPNSD